MQVYDLAREAVAYDLVLFMGVLYHLRYPLLGLDIVAERVRRLLVFQSLSAPEEEVREETHGYSLEDRDLFLAPGWPRMAFIEHHFASDPTNWWAPNRACCEALLRSSGMRITARPGAECFLCEPDPDATPPARSWNRGEFLAAIGQGSSR
jgi:tRNA (mo5U34)-methyltransferase